MDTYTLISNLTSSLAWPIATVLIVHFLKEDIGKVLLKIKHIKHKNTEIDLGKEISETSKLAKKDPDLKLSAITNESTLVDELATLSPRGAILESWLSIEKELDNYVVRHNIEKSGSKTFTLDEIAWHSLDYQGLGKGAIEILKKLRTIRNEAVHLQDSNIEPIHAKKYAALAKRMAQKIEET